MFKLLLSSSISQLSYKQLSLLLVVRSYIPHHKAHRTPVPEQNTTKAQEAKDFLHAPADRRTGEAIPQTEIPGVSGTRVSRQDAEDDRRSSQDLVSKPTYKMEVSSSPQKVCRPTAEQRG
jgi:hypothetical protein